MKKEDLRKIINQIRKYDLVETFDNSEGFEIWLSSLNKKQIENFKNLTVEPSIIAFPKYLLINENLLNCDDYYSRVNAMLKLTNGKGCLHLFDRLCNKQFLSSKNYYQDIDLISQADTARYALWIIDKETFINSPYHTEDLKLIVFAKDTKKENERDCRDSVVAEALATTAMNSNSINSPYHQVDMKLIATCGSENLQSTHNYPYNSVNTLAIDEVSLKDRYHLENMQILAKNPIAGKYLYKIMTDYEFVNGKYYRDEINALLNAKSKTTARAIYNYIYNPKTTYDHEFNDELTLTIDDPRASYIWLSRNNNIKGNLNPKYLEYLKLLNNIDDKFVLHFETLLSDKDLYESKYYEHDLNFILKINNLDEVFMDLYKVMLDIVSITHSHHINDLKLISEERDRRKREWLVEKATEEHSVESPNHEYDMQYISKLNFDIISKEQLNLMRYYLFNHNGIKHPHHIEILDRLYKGESIKNYNLYTYLDELEEQLNNSDDEINNLVNNNKSKNKVLSRIKKLLCRR